MVINRSIIMLVLSIFILSGCSKQEDSNIFKGQEGDWSLNIPVSYSQTKEEKLEEQNLYITSFEDKSGKMMSISEQFNSNRDVNHDTLKNDIKEDNYLHLIREETIKLEEGTVYGALIEDESIEYNLFYYKFKKDNKELTFIIYQKDPFTVEEEAEIKAMISTLKIL